MTDCADVEVVGCGERAILREFVACEITCFICSQETREPM